MKITTETASELGTKLAGLDLSEEEGVLLTTLLGAGAQGADDVEGFGKPNQPTNTRPGYTEVEWTYVKNVLGPLPGAWKVEEGESLNFEKIEWT